MRCKVLRTKTEPKEFVWFDNINGEPIIYTSDLPHPLPITSTLEGLKKYYDEYWPLPHDINFDDFEMVEFEMTEII